MRFLPLILGLLLISGLTVQEFYEFFVTNEGIDYFASEPRRLLYVILLAVAGGVVAVGVSRLSPRSQRRLKLTAVGGFAVVLTSATFLFAYHLSWAASMISGGSTWAQLIAALLGFLVVAGAAWLEFGLLWRQA